MKRPLCLLTLIFLLSILALLITAFHTTDHCFLKVPGVSGSACPSGAVETCVNALFVYSDDFMGVEGVKLIIACSWSMQSYISGFIGPALTVLLFIVICAYRRDSSPGQWLMALTGLIVIALLASIGCMIYDIVKAFDEYNKNGDDSGMKLMPATYIANAAINFILVFFVVWTVAKARGEKEGNTRAVSAWDQPTSYQPSYQQQSYQQQLHQGFPSRR